MTKKTKSKVWEMTYPDGSISTMNFDPIKKATKERDEFNKKIMEWHNLIVKGLNNGLTHTIHDGRVKNIEWVRKRLRLWEAFGRCVFNLHIRQDYKYDEKELKEVAEEGYKKKKQ